MEASVGLLNEPCFGFSSDIRQFISRTLNTKPSYNFILRMFGSCVALLRRSDERYSIFDPHSRNRHGLIDPNGAACMMHFESVEGMTNYLEKISRSKHEQVDLYPIDVEILIDNTDTIDVSLRSSSPGETLSGIVT